MTTASQMSGIVLGLLAETHIHPGAGQSEGAIDLPVARERTTNYPIVPGSGVKGAIRDRHWREVRDRQGASDETADAACEELYGKPDEAGRLILSDAMLLLLPVRSLAAAYRWVTCPYLLERHLRHRELVGLPEVELPTDLRARLADDGNALPKVLVARGQGRLFLEERVFEVAALDDPIASIVGLLKPLIGHATAQERLEGYLALVSDDELAALVAKALPVHAHNRLSKEKVSTSLWYEETIAPDTLLYALAVERTRGALAQMEAFFFGAVPKPYLQLGGNETLGQGWFRVARVSETKP